MNLFHLGKFTLSGGATSQWKIDCDALTDEDLRTLAYMAFHILPPYNQVYGVPQGGLRFANAMREFAYGAGRPLIVDDVLTTGGSLERYKARLHPSWGEPLGLVIFARGPCPSWVRALFTLSADLWEA